MANSTSPQPPPPIQTSPASVQATTVSPTSGTSSTITPGHTAKPFSATPFTPFPPTPDYDDVESPSLTSGNALARFEFEKLDGKDARDVGTKVLMVEWEDDDITALIEGEWTVGWESKSVAAIVPTSPKQVHTTSAARRNSDQAERRHRLYFLLPHWQRVPGTIIITLTGINTILTSRPEQIVWRTHPLPAIYPAALGNSARAEGKRGVLHTIWAKKRLQSLADEIEQEQLENPEGVSLDLAIQERDWIEGNFGVKTKPRGIDLGGLSATSHRDLSSGNALESPNSPRSPGRGPLLEKMKGLKLATGEGDLKARQIDSGANESEHNPLSPETADVAVSWTTFAASSGLGMSKDTLRAKTPQPPQLSKSPPQQQSMRFFAPPQSVLQQQRQEPGMSSLNAFTAPSASSLEVEFRGGYTAAPQPRSQSFTPSSLHENEEEDLFALPMSPRSPDQNSSGSKKFTFGEEDTARYATLPQAG